MDPVLLKKTLIGVVEILTAGMFVYFGLQAKWSFGNEIYYPLAIGFLIAGMVIAYSKG